MVYQVISTKCPVLNVAFRLKCMSSSPDLEVLLRLKDYELTDVVCSEYTPEKGCANREEGCIYGEGWQSLK